MLSNFIDSPHGEQLATATEIDIVWLSPGTNCEEKKGTMMKKRLKSSLFQCQPRLAQSIHLYLHDKLLHILWI